MSPDGTGDAGVRDPGGDTAENELPYDDPELGAERLANDPILWLAQSRLREELRSPWFDRGRYPIGGSVRDFYLDPTNKLNPRDLRDVLRALLPDGADLVGSDVWKLQFQPSRHTIMSRLKSNEATEYERRLIKAFLGRAIEERRGKTGVSRTAAPIPDLTWIIDLVFFHPAQAFDVAHAYLSVHFWILPDQVIDGIYDFMATVRCHFRLDSTDDADLALLRSLPPRNLEYLAAALWRRMGYSTVVTPATRDGGKDVTANRDDPGRSETVLIECRQWAKPIAVTAARELIGVIDEARANKGIIVAPGGFSTGKGSITDYAAHMKRIELVDGPRLCALLTEHCGPDWPTSIDRYIQEGQPTIEA